MEDHLDTGQDPEPADPPAAGASDPADAAAPAAADMADAAQESAPSVAEGYEATGVPAADAALQRLRDVATAPLEDHVEIFEDVHQRLHDGLAELDDEP